MATDRVYAVSDVDVAALRDPEPEPCFACGLPWQEPMMDARDAEDYKLLLQLTTETYMRITGGMVSKPFTDPVAVASLVDDRLSELDAEIEGLRERLARQDAVIDAARAEIRQFYKMMDVAFSAGIPVPEIPSTMRALETALDALPVAPEMSE